MLKDLFFVFIGGGIGATLRWALHLLMLRFPSLAGIPVATLMANVLGSFLVGLAAGLLTQHPNPTLRLIIIIGVCGGFTTFSSFSLENIFFITNHEYGKAAVYISGSLLLCLAGTFAGYKMVR